MGNLTFRPVQIGIITRLRSGIASPSVLARSVYRLMPEATPTKSQLESVRRALRGLEDNEFVRLTKYIWDKERCWELTGEMMPIPEKKKQPAKKAFAVVGSDDPSNPSARGSR
jgi:hypothetical protein